MKYYETIVTLRNWTYEEIQALDQINKTWFMTSQKQQRGNDD
jgi:hypothetical protein